MQMLSVNHTLRYILTTAAIGFLCSISLYGSDPTATDYTFEECRGSAMPYVVPVEASSYPDSLKPVFINHVGRHGARYPANSRNSDRLYDALRSAKEAGEITDLGSKLTAIVENVKEASAGRWGALDSLGIAEQWGLAARMYAAFPDLFSGTEIHAISSYSPRCIMSMYSFIHQLTRLNNHIEVSAESGRKFSKLMRFFDDDKSYREFASGDSWRNAYNDYCEQYLPLLPLRRVLGNYFSTLEPDQAREVAMSMYSVLAGTAAMDMECDLSVFYSRKEINYTWSCFNFKQYLLHSASTLSSEPAEISAPLLLDIIRSTDQAISDNANGVKHPAVRLRFGHAETLMPLLALMHVDGCYYLTNYFDTVGMHWRDFSIVPMAANLQIVLFKGPAGRYYARVDLNERPVQLIPGKTYVEWGELRARLNRCLPIIYQD